MKDVCKSCKYSKPKSDEYCYCVKYGCPIRYGRTYCISYEGDDHVHEEVRQQKDRS